MNNFYLNNHIYTNKELQSLISELEARYAITEDFDSFEHHVNFSQNSEIPVHSWFKYREGYSHKLIDILLSDSGITDKEFVIDPFCGSGTTQLQANIHGISSLGIDINPMSVFVSQTKSKSVKINDISSLREELERLINDSKSVEVDINELDEIAKYFDTEKIVDLIKIFRQIDQIDCSEFHDFFRLCALSLVEPVSNRKRDGNGLATRATKVKDVYKEFKAKSIKMINDLEILSQKDFNRNFQHIAISDNSENLHKHVNEFIEKSGKLPGAIIFSPPYANSFDYFESYKLELIIGGYSDSIKNLKSFRSGAVRSFISDTSNREIWNYRIADLLAEDIELSIPEKEKITGKTDSRTRKVPRMIKTYFNDMANIIEQCSLSLPSGKKCYIVVDQSSYLGKIVPSDLLLADIAESKNFTVEKIVICRKAKTSPQQLIRFPYLKDALRESIVVLRKK